MLSNTEPWYIKYLHAKSAHTGEACSGTFELTARCNFNCKMCYIHSSDINSTDKSGELTAEEWVSIARSASERGLLFLLLTGGEPLLRDDFEEIYRKIREMGILISVNTNGFLLNDALIAMFAKYPPRRMNISLYGCSEKTYVDLCGVDGFARVYENLSKLKEAGINTKINMPATPLNEKDINGVFDISEKMNMVLQATGYVFPAGRCDYSNECRLSAERSAAFDIGVVKYYKSEKEFAEYAKNALSAYTPLLNCDGEENSPCRAGKSSFWITWDGKMLPCGMLNKPYADVKEEGFSKAWEIIKDETSKIFLPLECTDCKYRCVCSVCAAKCACETGDFTRVPRYLCESARAKYEILRQYTGVTSNET